MEIELIAHSAVERRFNLQARESIMLLANVVPLHSMKNGRGTTRLYDLAAVKAAHARLVDAKKICPASVVPDAPALTYLGQQIKAAIEAAASDHSDHLHDVRDEILRAVAQITSQHAALLRAIESTRSDVMARISGVEDFTDALLAAYMDGTLKKPAKQAAK